MTVKERVVALRKLMQQHDLQAYIVPSSDSHMSEYVAQRWQSRKWIPGFTGSAGTAVILADNPALWKNNLKALKGNLENLYRLRAGNYCRVVFQKKDEE